MKYNIQIMSRQECIEFSSKDLKEEYIIISINNSDETTNLYTNPKIIDVLSLTFDDLLPKHLSKGATGKLMELSQAIKIREFVDKYKDQIANIIVHCTMGISRSAGVGYVLSRYLNGDDMYLFKTGKHNPNRHCYKLMCYAFKLDYNVKEFLDKLKISNKKCFDDLKGYSDYGVDLNDMFGGMN